MQLKERLNEHASNEKKLTDVNEELQRKVQEYEHRPRRSGSSSSSSSSSTETVITTSVHMEQIRTLTKEKEQLKKEYSDLEEKYDYEKHELQAIVEQLREDIIDLEKTKHFHEGKWPTRCFLAHNFRFTRPQSNRWICRRKASDAIRVRTEK